MINNYESIELDLVIQSLVVFIGVHNSNRTINQLLDSDIKWVRFQNLLKLHSIHLPVYHAILFSKVNELPTTFINNARKFQNFANKRNKRLAFELMKLCDTFKDKGIESIPYKGLPFSKQFYGNIFQRTSVDIDFALGIKDFQKVKEVMLGLGYEEFKSKINHNLIEESRAYYLDYPFVKRNAEGQIVFNVEFHWTPSHQILNIPISFKEFMDKTVELNFGENTLTTFDKVHQALFAVIHHGNVDCWGKLKHLLDFALIMNTLNEKETKELAVLCKKYRIYKSLQIGKGLLAEVLDDERYKDIKVSQRWKNDIINGELVGKWSDNKMKLWYFLSSRDNFLDKIKAATSIFKYQLFIKSKFN